MQYKGKGGLIYNLDNMPFAQGGEGTIYNIAGMSDKVAKIYKTDKIDDLGLLERERKLEAMISNPPQSAFLKQIAWPLDLLYSDGLFVGFVMPRVEANENLNVIYEYGSSAKYTNIEWRNKVIMARNLCVVVDVIHNAGHVIGDFNPRNINVNTKTGLITMLDTDSFHIQDGKFRCPVGMPEYLSVEIQHKIKGQSLATAPLPTFSAASDNFALAIHIFQILMNGVHPFACAILPGQNSITTPMPSDSILRGEFAFMKKIQGKTIPKFAPPIEILPKGLQNLFKRAFIDGHSILTIRPSAEEWYNELSTLEKQLKACKKVGFHEYYCKLSKCPWCEADERFAGTIVKTGLLQTQIDRGLTKAPTSSGVTVPKHKATKIKSDSSDVRKKKAILAIVSVTFVLIAIVIAIMIWQNNDIDNLDNLYNFDEYNLSSAEGGYIITSVNALAKRQSSLTIPSSYNGIPIVGIGDEAFKNCENLIEITIPSSVKTVGKKAFENTGIWKNTENDSIVYADKWAVDRKGTLRGNLILQEDTVGLASEIFHNSDALISLVISSEILNIESGALRGCSSLQSLTIPFLGYSKTATAQYAVLGYIFGFTDITSSTKPSGTTYQYTYYDYGTRYVYYYIPASLRTVIITGGAVNANAFKNCTMLTSITMPSDITAIGNEAFDGCTNLLEVTIPNTVRTIGVSAFSGCYLLTLQCSFDSNGWLDGNTNGKKITLGTGWNSGVLRTKYYNEW